ncbi:MAG: cellulose biosynthesis cyclic di-GMP-binding regulatory protein BcsB [Rhodoblastus sp.]|nr:cellulose biosynthesis cyclic di-GMP-binding regulatory protein BcsB [Rhodoblastus sp.]
MRRSVHILSLMTAFLAAQADACLAQAIFTTAPPSLSRVIPYGSSPATAPAAPSQPVHRAPVVETAPRAPVAAQTAPRPSEPTRPVPPASSPIRSAPPALSAPPPAAYSFTRPQPAAPAPAPVPVQAQSAPQFAAPAVAASVAPATGLTLRHLTNNIQGFRLAGEIASSEWPVYITAEQARLPIKFQVGYLSAISVMPEASYLTLSVNDVVVGRANIRATHSVKTITFDIPLNALQAGFNSIRLTAEQRHRVDCSLQATYELWTQIDPSQTGLLLPRSTPVSRLSDLPALSPDAQGALPIRAVVPGHTNLANVERIMRAAQLISLHGRFEQPVVDIGPLADGEYGVNLVVGPASDVASLVDLRAAGPISGPRVLIIPANPRLRTTIVVTGATDAQVSEALAEFDASQKPIGAPAGLRAAAAFPGLHIEGGQRVKLRDLGVASEEFSGRLFRAAFNVILPPDFYPADYGKAIVDLAGGYAPGLTTEAHIVVSVNGRNAVSMKLPKAAGDVFTKNPIPLPLGAMRPGLNRVEIEALVPMASDSACDPLAAISGAKRFLLLDSTEIELPRIARIARMPDLAVTTTGAFPFAAEGMRPKIVAPSPDRETIGAAATIAAHMAIMAGRPIDFQLTGALPQKGSGSVLVVGGANVLDPSLLRAAGIDPQAVQKAWSGRFDRSARPVRDEALSRYESLARNRLVLERNFPSACRMPKPPGGFERAINSAFRRVDDVSTATIRQSQSRAIFVGPNRRNSYDHSPVGSLQITGQASGALFDEWNSKVRSTNAFSSYVQRTYASMREWTSARVEGVVSWFGATLASGPVEPEINARASLIVAQNMIGDTIDDVWTLVTAPTSADLAESVPCLVDPRVWRQIAGRMSILDASEGSVVTAPARAQRLIVTQPLTIENSRLIAAGWLSLNSQIYVAVALVIAMLLALTTSLFVRNVGRRQP